MRMTHIFLENAAAFLPPQISYTPKCALSRMPRKQSSILALGKIALQSPLQDPSTPVRDENRFTNTNCVT